jgi:8-hydroxy-5-deazaflavin:NADPH oxidoreductase
MTAASKADPTVSIIGATGALGFGLALRLGRSGVPVVIGSRDAQRAAEAAGRAAELVGEDRFTGMDNAGAAGASEVVVLSVPFRNQAETIKQIAGGLRSGQIVLDATVPLATAVGGRPTRVLRISPGSAAQQAQELVPAGVRVVSALHTVSAAALTDLDHAVDEDALICGDDAEAKRTVAALLGRIDGLRPVDVGALELAGIVEPLTALLISVNRRHKTHAGIRLTGVPDPVDGQRAEVPA